MLRLEAERNIKVLMLGLRGLPNVQGGVEAYAENLGPMLVEHGLDLQVIARSPYVPAAATAWKGIRIKPLWSPRSQAFEAIVHTLIGVFYAAWMRPDVVHIQAIGPALLTPVARMLGLRVVVTHHGQDYLREKWGRGARAILRLGEWAGMTFANRRIAVSRGIRESVEKEFGVQCDAIPNGVTAHPVADSRETLDRLGIQAERYVLSVARWVPEKRQEDLIHAFQRAALPGVKLVLAGAADHTTAYAHRVAKLVSDTPNVIAAGFVTGLPLRELYSHAKLFVLPSSHEGLPIALLEALSYGVPALASAIPANLEIGLNGENYFAVGDVPALAESLRRKTLAPNDESNRAEIRRWVSERYSWQRAADQTANVLREVALT